MPYILVTLADRPELEGQLSALNGEAWPPFILEDAIAARCWERLLRYFPQYQLALLDEQHQLVAAGNTIPLNWNGLIQDLPEGWDAALERGVNEYERKQQPTALSALAILVKPALRGQAISRQMIEAMRQLAITNNLSTLIAPVRPSFKSHYPLISMDDYVTWTREDGLPFDPWIRTHARLGARILKVAPKSMIITGTVRKWETWTGMCLPQSGFYVIPQALVPLVVSYE